ncbi:MAG: hypothetical protein ACTSYD_09695 [Candidatus Heimdallarchaeaceae archaeon]
MSSSKTKYVERVKNYLKPQNIATRINSLPLMDKVYWSKVIVSLIGGTVFGLTDFRAWPAVLTMFAIFLIISTIWALAMKNKEQGIKLRAYYTSAIFQYLITFVAVWTIIQNALYVPPSNW